MSEFAFVISVIIMFIVRIGIPMILLVTLGTIFDRWQHKMHTHLHNEAHAS